MFTCTNKGYTHQHETAIQGRICYGLIQPSSPSYEHPTYAPRPPAITPRQLRYVGLIGGDETYAAKLTKDEAIRYIDQLKKGGATVMTQPAQAVPRTDPRLEMLASLIKSVPDGYFAVAKEEGASTTFVRISRPKSRTYAGSIKVQTQHGPNLKVAAALWSSDSWSIFDRRVIDAMLLLVVDYQGASLRYAREIGKCCRCNSPLTDERSRHYGIGPECEEYHTWIVPMVDELYDGKSFEQISREQRAHSSW